MSAERIDKDFGRKATCSNLFGASYWLEDQFLDFCFYPNFRLEYIANEVCWELPRLVGGWGERHSGSGTVVVAEKATLYDFKFGLQEHDSGLLAIAVALSPVGHFPGFMRMKHVFRPLSLEYDQRIIIACFFEYCI